MRLLFRGLLLAATVGVTGAVALVAWPIGIEPPGTLEILEGNVDRGAYLARASGCIACHSNFEVGGAPLAGGAPLETDFGTFYPPNLTTDPDHGMGAWTISDFARAVRQGISPEGEPYYPTFTFPFYARFSDQDIADLWAAFQTVPAVPEPSPAHEASFPFDQRWGLKLWRAAYLSEPDTDAVEERSDAWNRGKWLVRGAAHCGACHTDRNFAGARITDRIFAGNDSLPGGKSAPSILPTDLQAAGWDADSLAYALRTGITPEGDVFGGSMAEVVNDGTAFLSDADLAAMATYILGNDLSEN
ncbi:Alcohol dehydrogenase cytochrome c subunit [Falsiruegeria mediterranea M17]|uniref:Alcohol dehydrogenase cytochrome c subunit n=1 Tax=Falsiruegeria mediterranea M17 TaxID=1200281 RepID=A0A2R8C287_9RHOB|nr:Alcohol dehydrogenase cytochrome c subunit [Falsiruegeria mediterranea M17]